MSGKITKYQIFAPSLKWTYFVYFYIENELNALGCYCNSNIWFKIG